MIASIYTRANTEDLCTGHFSLHVRTSLNRTENDHHFGGVTTGGCLMTDNSDTVAVVLH